MLSRLASCILFLVLGSTLLRAFQPDSAFQGSKAEVTLQTKRAITQLWLSLHREQAPCWLPHHPLPFCLSSSLFGVVVGSPKRPAPALQPATSASRCGLASTKCPGAPLVH